MSVSNRRAKEVLDWSPTTPFAGGVRRYLDWLGDARAAASDRAAAGDGAGR